jgi:hypothetical protein
LGGSQPKDKGNSATARELGVDEKEVRNASKIANIAPDAKEAAHKAGSTDNKSVPGARQERLGTACVTSAEHCGLRQSSARYDATRRWAFAGGD